MKLEYLSQVFGISRPDAQANALLYGKLKALAR